MRGRRPVSNEQLFLEKVSPEPNTGCWLWMGATNSHGKYGTSWLNKKSCSAHRVSYMLFVGPIPEGLELDHLCRNTFCVNPRHLEPVTRLENIRRGTQGLKNRSKTHCKHGHPFDGINSYTDRFGKRKCRACQSEEWQAKKKGIKRSGTATYKTSQSI